MYAYLLTHSLAAVSSARSGRLKVAIFLRSWESEWEESDTHKKGTKNPNRLAYICSKGRREAHPISCESVMREKLSSTQLETGSNVFLSAVLRSTIT